MIPKIHYQFSQEELVRSLDGEMTQFFFEGHRKSAASDIFTREKIASLAPPKGKFGVHCVIVGAEEFYGPNRNGDSFPKEALQKYGSTFVTHGHMFREHRNRDPKLKIGEIKAAEYHPKLHRTELFLWGDCEKAAAEYADAKAGKQRSYSMSCRVPYDICSICDQKSASTRDYCDDLRFNMLQFDPGKKKYAYARNTKPTFFDASDVGRPADRIAHGLEYVLNDSMAKAANEAGQFISGATLAEMAGVSLPDNAPLSDEHVRMLQKLAAAESKYDSYRTSSSAEFLCKFAREVAVRAYFRSSQLTQADFDKLAKVYPETLFHELAKRACMLSFEQFVDYTNGCKKNADPELVKYALPRLHECFSICSKEAAAQDNTLPGADMFAAGSAFMADIDPGNMDDVQQVMDQVEREVGADPQALEYRTCRNVMGGNESDYHTGMGNMTPNEEVAKRADIMLQVYGAYKAAAVADIAKLHPGIDMDCLTMLAVSQNAIYR